ncbi:hypothetical protein MSAR_14160 [Mycolicibacterium sarraceniae]|uniref:Antitoxin Xre/MbcA/ParS-like toxin-binding domain-containing protein n=1 Tax=Mycolicibacterium sarraceniae TaxID=1534348 RepID=A0A7I7SP43_9MYCO|nr:hypothetical protein MSAR_14160 [Mycolicibacterium sarraceniae]
MLDQRAAEVFSSLARRDQRAKAGPVAPAGVAGTPLGALTRIRMVGQLVNQLRHTFTGPGVIAWFYRCHPTLGERPVDLLDDPLRYPEVLSAATVSRAMTA